MAQSGTESPKRMRRAAVVRWVLAAWLGIGACLLSLLCIMETDIDTGVEPVQTVELTYISIPPAPKAEKDKPKEVVKPRPKPKEPVTKKEPAPEPSQAPPQLSPTPSPSPDAAALPAGQPDGTSDGAGEPALEAPAQLLSVSSAQQLDNVTFLPLFNPPPTYPPIARNAGIEGFAEVELIIDKAGRIESFTVTRISGHPAFGSETEKVIHRWRFPPPRKNGKAVRVKYVYRVTFRLDG